MLPNSFLSPSNCKFQVPYSPLHLAISQNILYMSSLQHLSHLTSYHPLLSFSILFQMILFATSSLPKTFSYFSENFQSTPYSTSPSHNLSLHQTQPFLLSSSSLYIYPTSQPSFVITFHMHISFQVVPHLFPHTTIHFPSSFYPPLIPNHKPLLQAPPQHF